MGIWELGTWEHGSARRVPGPADAFPWQPVCHLLVSRLTSAVTLRTCPGCLPMQMEGVGAEAIRAAAEHNSFDLE